MGDFTRLHRCSFIKEDSRSLRKLGEALASGQAYLRSGLWQWHSAQVLPVQVQLQVQAIPLTTTPQASENNGLEPGDSGWVSSPLPQLYSVIEQLSKKAKHYLSILNNFGKLFLTPVVFFYGLLISVKILKDLITHTCIRPEVTT